MFEDFKKYKKILVTGPQRAGTRICAKMIAQDTGHKYVDESVIKVKDTKKLNEIMKYDEDIVIQCPGASYCIERYSAPDTLIIFMVRPVEDILASQKRIDWGCNSRELDKYNVTEGNACEVKYKFWEEQREKIENWKEVDYNSLSSHSLWLDKEFRVDFKSHQTKV